MQKQNDLVVQGSGQHWMLSFGAVRIHNDHVQGGRRTITGCSVCEEGLGGALAATTRVEKPLDGEKVVEGDGADKEGDAASPPDPWADWR